MAKRPILSFYPTRNCFRKKYKGTTYYLGKGGKRKAETETQYYDRACGEWFTLKAQLDHEARKPIIDPQHNNPRHNGNGSKANGTTASMASIHKRRELPQHDESPKSRQLTYAVEDYLNSEYRTDAENGDKAISTYRAKKDDLEDFVKFALVYERFNIDEIDGPLLKRYRDDTKSLPEYVAKIKQGKQTIEQVRRIGPHTAKSRLAAVRAFMEWAYRNHYIDQLPRNIDRTYANVSVPDPEPQTFSRDEVRELFAAANERNKFSRTKSRRPALYVLLGINCGYGQGAIATLRHEHIDWDTGIIRRKREKTGSPQCHKLWGITQQILKEEMTDPKESELVLLGQRGQPLVEEDLDKLVSRTNPIGRSLERVKRKLIKAGNEHWKGPNKGIAILRKTGADYLKQQHPSMPHIYKQYLGHKYTGSDPSRVDRHYVNDHYQELFDALDGMEQYFDLEGTENE